SLQSSGVISGTPQIAGSFTFTVRATDSGNPAQTATRSLTLRVPPLINTNSLPNGLINSPYSQTLAAAPTTATPLHWNNPSGLPTGLSISDDGVLSGTPTVSGTFNFTVVVTDSCCPPGPGSNQTGSAPLT